MQVRPWKYNTKKWEHWVDTDESGELSFLDREKLLEQTEAEADGEGEHQLALDFNAGPRAVTGGTGCPDGEGGVEGEARSLCAPRNA